MNGSTQPRRFVSNKVVNQKYNIITFIPIVLFNQFKFFFNLFFLLICMSQFIPALKVGKFSLYLKSIGFMFTYFSPLCFVLFVTLMKEGWDDIARYRRDKEINNKEY